MCSPVSGKGKTAPKRLRPGVDLPAGHAGVAQLAEQRICNPQVWGSNLHTGSSGRVAEWLNAAVLKTAGGILSSVGSNPTPSARTTHQDRGVAQMVVHMTLTHAVAGSIPAASAITYITSGCSAVW